MRLQPYHLTLAFTACFSLSVAPSTLSAEASELRGVRGLEAFGGSAAARDLLARNGFVVADPAFRQIFEPYIRSPQIEEPSEANPGGRSLPSFITTDSAWHTYHVLLEEGVKQLEEVQSRRMLDFSRRLSAAAQEPKAGAEARSLALFASVGLALQDESRRQSLEPEAKRIVEALRKGAVPVDAPIGFPLAPQQFRAQGFCTQSPELSDYFAARQWYAGVVFRLSNPRETRMALALASLVNDDAALLSFWKQLSEPLDTLLAPAEDGTVREYTAAAKAVLGTNWHGGALADAPTADIQKRLEGELPLPRVNDQLLLPEEYAGFPKQTRGFRLLPPRRLPCAVCFLNTVDPKIPNRAYPSGLDFLAASPVLRSPAAVRAVADQFGKSTCDLIVKADCGPMPDSLHGEAMQLLATLQKPLPPQAPAAMRNEAWADLQLWTQLGAWVEQRHTWALHAKLAVSVSGIVTPPKGMVAPCPEFFSGLAELARRTAAAFETAGLGQQFETKTAATNLLEALSLSQGLSRSGNEKEIEKDSGKLEQLAQFQARYYDKHRAELEKSGPRDAHPRLEKELEEMARRCAVSGQANQAETETLQLFFECRQNIVRLLKDFAPVCDRLAGLAKKSLAAQPLTEDDARWIENYGITLAGFSFYYGDSYEAPRDDFPIVTRVFSNPLTGSTLYAGLARPQALYIVAADGNVKQLYRGAVMTYREFVRPNEQLLDDESWRDLISKGQTPPAPLFTRSFCAETSVPELIRKLRVVYRNEEPNPGDLEDILWQMGSRATEKDLPDLFDVLVRTKGEDRADIIEGVGNIIARLPWESHRKQLIELLASNDTGLADAAARILTERPASLDPTVFISGFNQQPTRTRRLYCAILSRFPQQTDATRKFFVAALHDRADGVRWQAAVVIGKAGWNNAAIQTDLVESLNDPNALVGAAAAYSLGRLGATNAAPALLARLKTRLRAARTLPAEMESQASAITQDLHSDINRAPAYQLLDPDDLEMRIGHHVPARAKQRASMRLPPQPITLPTHDYTLVDALIEALGELRYPPAADELFKLRGTDYDAEATRSLGRLAPERLTGDLLATANDRNLDSYLREQAMVTLANLAATNRVRDLVPLLDDQTPIIYSRPLPGPEWRICDRAAATIAAMLGWQDARLLRFVPASRRQELLNRAREWSKSTGRAVP